MAPATAHAEAFGAGRAQQDEAAVEGSSLGRVEGPRATSEGKTQLHHCSGKSCSTRAQVQLTNICSADSSCVVRVGVPLHPVLVHVLQSL